MAQQDPIPATAADRDFEIYNSLREYEQHFNQTQIEVKKLASAWMLATFAAIAFIVRGDLTGRHSLLDSGSRLVLIGLGGNIGLLSLWILDQRVSQRLLGAAFRVGMLLERSNPMLPPIRSRMWLNAQSHGVGRLHSFFYVCPMAFNFCAAAYGLTQTTPERYQWLSFGLAAAEATLLAPFGEWLIASFEIPSKREDEAIKATVTNWMCRHQAHDDFPGQT